MKNHWTELKIFVWRIFTAAHPKVRNLNRSSMSPTEQSPNRASFMLHSVCKRPLKPFTTDIEQGCNCNETLQLHRFFCLSVLFFILYTISSFVYYCFFGRPFGLALTRILLLHFPSSRQPNLDQTSPLYLIDCFLFLKGTSQVRNVAVGSVSIKP